MTTPPTEQAPDTLRTHFEALASDPSFKLRRSRRGNYVNPAVARDWKWFQLGANRAHQPAPGAPNSADELARDLKNAIDTATELREQLRLMEEQARNEVWRWQADGADDLATMGNRMGVLIYASDLRNLIATPQIPAPTEQQAYDMGAKGAPATDAERLLFEAWMRGHCWALCATWDGKCYRSDAEQNGNIDPRAMNTRQLWASWRDRAALSAQQGGA